MSYQDYEAADFAADASFQAWVQRTDEQAARFWEQWAAAHPEKRCARGAVDGPLVQVSCH